MCQRFRDLSTGQTALEPTAQVRHELVVVTHRGECSNGDQAAVSLREIRPPPQVVEHDVVGELHEFRRIGSEVLAYSFGSCRV